MYQKRFFQYLLTVAFLLSTVLISAQTVNVGSASYTKTYPGVDEAGRNSYPQGEPRISGNAVGKPIPTNDWWSAKLNNDHVSNLFSYPITMKTNSAGLVMTYIPWGVVDDYDPITVGVSSLAAAKATVSDYSDWTVTMDWTSGSNNFTATMGIAMPFVYFTKANNDVAQIAFNSLNGTITVKDEMIVIENAHREGSFAFYAPSGSTWEKNGEIYTSTLNGKNYWSAAFIPQNASVMTKAEELKKYAYVFPTNTEVTWDYNEATGAVRSEFKVTPDVKEGTNNNVLMGLLPHQWGYLADDSPKPMGDSYGSVRGEIKTLDGNSFTVEHNYYGILPTLPYVDEGSQSFDATKLAQKVTALENEELATWTDSYNEGQVMNRLMQTARIADLQGYTQARDKMVATVKERLEDWLSYESGEIAFLFYYNETWTAMLGYPAGHGQDGNLNDHHFHWGYFIHAAAFMEQFEPGWADKWGDMINLLIRDAASPNRNDDTFPFLRNFSPYAGHCWANGFATFPQGNDQESTSESMQFNSSLIHWGTITGNDEIRDLGIYLYTTEQSAVEEYWFDVNERIFPDNQYSLVSRVWGNSYDNGTFWTGDIAASYGIEMYPIHGGSMYLGHNHEYVEKLWEEITKNTGILQNAVNLNLWHDIYWEYLAFINPAKAIQLYDSNPNRELKFGVSDAQTYHWLHAMNALGKVDATVTADYPIAVAFTNGYSRSYTAHNYGSEDIVVTFSDGMKLNVPAGKMASEVGDASLIPGVVEITNPEDGEEFTDSTSIKISAEVAYFDTTIQEVKFYANDELIGIKSTVPYEVNWLGRTGNYNLTAIATALDGETDTSDVVAISFVEGAMCEGFSSNGDFKYEFSVVDGKYYITFVPLRTKVGDPTCLLYYGKGSGPYPGYGATANVPFELNISKGETINFYYVYAYDGPGEKNSIEDNASYTAGSCKGKVDPDPDPDPDTEGDNLALNKTVYTSSDESGDTPGRNAVDGNGESRWSSLFEDPQWIYVDLGASKDIKQVVLKWEVACASKYEVQTSDDASTWTTVFTENAGNGGTDDITVDASARYVRIYGIERATPYGYSLFELEVYGESAAGLENAFSESLKVYPNPATDVLFFSQEVSNIELYSLMGQKIYEQPTRTTQVNLSNINAGVYLLKADVVGVTVIKNLIIK